ncbi:type II secretion system protein [Anatilimnocola floriformis]|uniref:type II secretion system protein n=1 Tax=Anatilimnocola floriformis TaxID=2948575 RepID=UPI0020C45484|nr:prepilin-type N-terminal cleavage/methylation domain-containing protein [Anatilimnocola floriformis]
MDISAHKRKQLRRAFTLIEVLMVITAMSIIAGVVVPQVGSAIDEAKHSSMLAQQRQLSLALEHYQIEHNGRAPDDLTNHSLPQLLNATDAAGTIGTTASHRFGPYIKPRMPVNPLNSSSDVYRSNTAPPTDLTSRIGWVYHPESGQIWAGLYQGIAPSAPVNGSPSN